MCDARHAKRTKDSIRVGVRQLGLSENDFRQFKNLIRRPNGIVLVTQDGYLVTLDVDQLPYTIEEALLLNATDHIVTAFSFELAKCVSTDVRERMLGILAILFFLVPTQLMAGDWPQWRYDAGRGAVTPEQLAATLDLAWTRQLPAPEPAWPASQPWLRFDASYTPVTAAGRLFVPSMVNDCVTAYDLASGRELWRFLVSAHHWKRADRSS